MVNKDVFSFGKIFFLENIFYLGFCDDEFVRVC